MIRSLAIGVGTVFWTAVAGAAEPAVPFEMNPYFLTLAACMRTIGASHGDIAVSPVGDIYVSVEAGDHPGIQVYSAQGSYLRNVPNAPYDFHGFIIATGPDGTPNIFGASLVGQQIVQMTLEGKILRTISAASIPDRYKTDEDGKLSVYLTGVAVAPNGDIYVVDGYGRDFIHRFDKEGRYLATFAGQGEPWNFKNCHKIAIDPRFEPVRLLCTDRLHDRLVHMDLDGHVIGVFAKGLRWPSALAVFKDELAVAELGGRVTVLDRKGAPIASIGANENQDEIKTNRVPPEKWQPNLFWVRLFSATVFSADCCKGRPGIAGTFGEQLVSAMQSSVSARAFSVLRTYNTLINKAFIVAEKSRTHLFYAPHGIAFDASGNLLVTEWNQWGRVVCLVRKAQIGSTSH